jgi:hypothetical protein
LLLGRLLVAVLALAPAGLTYYPLEEFTILELVLDGVTMVVARLLQELLEMVILALSLTCLAGRCDRIGLGVTSAPPHLLLLRCGGTLILLRLLGLSHGLAIREDCPNHLIAGGMVRGDI